MYFLSILNPLSGPTTPALAVKTTPWSCIPFHVRQSLSCEKKRELLYVRNKNVGVFSVAKRRWGQESVTLVIGQEKPIITALLCYADDVKDQHAKGVLYFTTATCPDGKWSGEVLELIRARPRQPMVFVGPNQQDGPVASPLIAFPLRVVDWFAVSWITQIANCVTRN